MQLVAVVLDNMSLSYIDRSGIKAQVKHSFSAAVLFFKVILSDLHSQGLPTNCKIIILLRMSQRSESSEYQAPQPRGLALERGAPGALGFEIG